jgi:ABC-2 type transport system ATP-binding protein
VTALLEANQLRVDADGIAVVDGLTLRTTGAHVLVLGGPRALFEAAAGLRPVARGELRIGPEIAARACTSGSAAAAPHDPPVPLAWTPRAYVTWSARLVGHRPRDARDLARDAIARLRMQAIAESPLGRLPPHARRATVVAAALATGAADILLDDPLGGLPDDAARPFARALAKGLEDRRWIVFAPRVSLDSPLAIDADEAIVLSASSVIAQGAPAEIATRERTYSIRVQGAVDAWAKRAADSGARIERAGAHLAVELGEGQNVVDLLALALESGAVIVELCPLSRALT